MAVAAYNRSATYFLFAAFLFFATANPLANALTINLVNTTVTGRLCCSSTGNCLLMTPPLAGVTLQLNCTNLLGATVTVGQGTTNATGFFNITVGGLTNINSFVPCTVSTNLPINATICPQLSVQTGSLRATVIPVTTLILNITNGLVNVLQIAVVGLFSIISGLL